MKTIFVPIFQGVEAKNILRTDIFKILKAQKDLRIVLFVSNQQKEQYFKSEFSGNNVIYEVFDRYKKPSFHRLFSFFKLTLINTRTMDLRRWVELKENKNYFKYYFFQLFSKIFARRFLRKIVRRLDWQLVRDENFKEIFAKYNPDLVFLANLFGDEETSMLRQTKRRGIKSIGLINSWDKITSRCMIRLLPDKLIVPNELVKEEAIKYVDMPENDIEIMGVPNYDVFINAKPSSKEEFYKKIGADISKRIIAFCPLGKTYSSIDSEIIYSILDLKHKNLIPQDTQLLVRFPPNDFVDLDNLKNKDELIFYQPGVRFSLGGKRLDSGSERNNRRVDWDMNDADIQTLYDTLFYMSLLICQASSLTIDASIFDKPIINFKIKSVDILPPRDANWLYQLSHYQNIRNSGGVKMVENKEQLAEWINKYLDNPRIHSDGRKRIVEEQCWKLDGKAGERTAKFILDALYNM